MKDNDLFLFGALALVGYVLWQKSTAAHSTAQPASPGASQNGVGPNGEDFGSPLDSYGSGSTSSVHNGNPATTSGQTNPTNSPGVGANNNPASVNNGGDNQNYDPNSGDPTGSSDGSTGMNDAAAYDQEND